MEEFYCGAENKVKFGEQSWLFNMRYGWLELGMHETGEFVAHVGNVDRTVRQLKLPPFTNYEFKLQTLARSVHSPNLAGVRTCMVNRKEQDANITLVAIVVAFQGPTNGQHNNKLIQIGEPRRLPFPCCTPIQLLQSTELQWVQIQPASQQPPH
ncbi:hypothetical protein TSMEX_001488 [Taenia solium]|eukprot:TsM_001179200 transcript=TsM_001179200 gene=TsM_001179200